jgi:hypothetical protein
MTRDCLQSAFIHWRSQEGMSTCATRQHNQSRDESTGIGRTFRVFTLTYSTNLRRNGPSLSTSNMYVSIYLLIDLPERNRSNVES